MNDELVAGVVWHPSGPITEAQRIKWSGPMFIETFIETLHQAFMDVGETEKIIFVGENVCWWSTDDKGYVNTKWRD